MTTADWSDPVLTAKTGQSITTDIVGGLVQVDVVDLADLDLSVVQLPPTDAITLGNNLLQAGLAALHPDMDGPPPTCHITT